MNTAKNTGRIIGVMLLAHLLTGLTLPYILLQPLTVSPANFLFRAADMALQVKLSVVLLFVGGVLPIGVTIMAWRILRERSRALAMWLIIVAVVNLVLQALENQQWLSMLFLSEQYVHAGAGDLHFLQTMGMLLRADWKWAHFTHLLFTVSWMLLLYVLLYRHRLVPRTLAIFGFVAIALQLAGITLPGLFSYSVPLSMDVYSMPIGIAYLGLILWLMIKGFKETPTVAGEAA